MNCLRPQVAYLGKAGDSNSPEHTSIRTVAGDASLLAM